MAPAAKPKHKGKKKRLISTRYTSPFRYPGGKNWFLVTARRWLKKKCKPSTVLIEPFAGGAGISLAAVREGLVKKVIFAETDPNVAATWETILNGHALWLADEIRSFRVSRERVEEVLSREPDCIHKRAFQCLLRNRTARGGVLKRGAGLLRRGEDGRGLRSRWYPDALAQRIEIISALKNDLEFCNRDGFELIREYLCEPDAVFFVDPPYTKAARRLYEQWEIDHAKLFATLSQARGAVLMTYDDTPEVRKWAEANGFKVRRISMRTTHHTQKRELMISRDFGWLQ